MPETKFDSTYDHYDFPTLSLNQKSGHPGYTTLEQEAKVQQLRTMLINSGYTERIDTLTLVSVTISCFFLSSSRSSKRTHILVAFSSSPQI